MQLAFSHPALINQEVLNAIERTSASHRVRAADLLAVIVRLQLIRLEGTPTPVQIAELAGCDEKGGRTILAALHADGWISDSGEQVVLHPPLTSPSDAVPSGPAPRHPLCKVENLWIQLGGEGLGEFACRRLHSSLTKTAPLSIPADVTLLAKFYRAAFPAADLGSFIRSTQEALIPLRSAALAAEDAPPKDWEDVHKRAAAIGGVWTRTAVTRGAHEPLWFIFASLRGVAPRDLAGSPLFLSDAIEAALCRHRSIQTVRLSDLAITYKGKNS